MSMTRTWEKVAKLVVMVQNAATEKDDKGEVIRRLPFRLLDWGVALNVSSKYGDGYDLEIGSPEGFATVGISDPEDDGKVKDFVVPAIGEWITVLNGRVSNELDSYGKRKIRIPSAWQIRPSSKQQAKLTDGGTKNGKRSRRAV